MHVKIVRSSKGPITVLAIAQNKDFADLEAHLMRCITLRGETFNVAHLAPEQTDYTWKWRRPAAPRESAVQHWQARAPVSMSTITHALAPATLHSKDYTAAQKIGHAAVLGVQ